MQSQVEIEEVDPSYNGDVVAESTALATTLDQYWLERRALSEQNIERNGVAAANTAAERDWQSFCSRGTGFLNKYLAKATDSIDAPLRQLWQCSFAMAHEARKTFGREASVEVWIPFLQYPLKFACVDPTVRMYQTREFPNPTHPENFELGKPHVMVRWRASYLLIILPNQTYVTLSTFNFTKDADTLGTEEVIPQAFLTTLAQFDEKLRIVEAQFAPLLAVLDAKERLFRATGQLQGIDRCAEAWRKVQLPDAQKLDILRRMELFENSDPAAPRGFSSTVQSARVSRS